MDIILRQVEIIADDCREGIVSLPVGGVRASIRQGHQVLSGERIGEKRGVMPLYGEKHVTALLDETCLHAVSPKRVLQLRSEAVITADSVGSGWHGSDSSWLDVPVIQRFLHHLKEVAG